MIILFFFFSTVFFFVVVCLLSLCNLLNKTKTLQCRNSSSSHHGNVLWFRMNFFQFGEKKITNKRRRRKEERTLISDDATQQQSEIHNRSGKSKIYIFFFHFLCWFLFDLLNKTKSLQSRNFSTRSRGNFSSPRRSRGNVLLIIIYQNSQV